MKTFRDNEGREWLVAVNVGTIETVQARVGIDLLNGEDIHGRLAGDPRLLVRTLFALCEKQAAERGQDFGEFAAAVTGEALARGNDALMGDLIDFFQPAKRAVMSKAAEKIRAAEKLLIERADRALDAMDVAALVAATAPAASDSSSGNGPALPA